MFCQGGHEMLLCDRAKHNEDASERRMNQKDFTGILFGNVAWKFCAHSL